MANTTVNTDVLHSETLKLYIDKADHRIRIGFRVALEALGIPLPDFIARRPSGPKPGQRIAAAFAADAAIHGDHGFTASGNRRLVQDGQLPPSRFPVAPITPLVAPGTQRPYGEQATYNPMYILPGSSPRG